MSKTHQAQRLNVLAFAQDGNRLEGRDLLQNMERIRQETQGLSPDSIVNWHARAELRLASSGDEQIWLHLMVNATLPLTCQRCMGPVDVSLHIDHWFRFVATEDIAMAEDDASEEDLLVMTPQFDLLALVEDELLMAMPLVPMHDECPEAVRLSAGELQTAPSADTRTAVNGDKPNPFAVLAQLKQVKKGK